MPLPPPSVEASPRRIRVRLGDELVADTTRAQLLVWFGPGMLPTYAIPAEDVRAALLRPSEAPASAPHAAAVPHTTAYDVHGAAGIAPGAAFRFGPMPEPLGAVEGHWTFAWEQGLAWFEEAMEVHLHARDTRKRIDVVPSDRHVRVELGGELLAESRRAHALFETDLPTRWYLPREDVRAELLPSPTVTGCPYKGTATYFSVRVGDMLHADLAWSYPDPVPECPRIAGLVCFFNEHVDLVLDGERSSRPSTPWSRPAA